MQWIAAYGGLKPPTAYFRAYPEVCEEHAWFCPPFEGRTHHALWCMKGCSCSAESPTRDRPYRPESRTTNGGSCFQTNDVPGVPRARESGGPGSGGFLWRGSHFTYMAAGSKTNIVISATDSCSWLLSVRTVAPYNHECHMGQCQTTYEKGSEEMLGV